MTFLTKQALLMPLLCMVLLSACGSGSDAGSENNNPPPADISSTDNGEFIISWLPIELQTSSGQVTANQYRVLYGLTGQRPDELITTETQITTPSLPSGEYTVIIEGYGPGGNSVFNQPRTVTN